MIIARVVGTVICTQKDQSLVGQKLLLAQPLKLDDFSEKGQPVVCLDAVGAGKGEVVLVVAGSSARLADGFSKVAVDQSIVGIVDSVEIKGQLKFSKSDPQSQ